MAGDEWSDEELRASVGAYLEMLRSHRAGEPYVKKQFYRDLSAKFGRTEKSYEYRAQNISHVLALLGREWIPGLVPAKNVGSGVVARIESFIAEQEGRPFTGGAEFESKVRSARKRRKKARPKGRKKSKPKGRSSPAASTGTVTTYERDAEVKAWVLDQADGICESCGEPAPFVNHEDLPFLEVHHVRTLADGGSDTVENAVALCPNCHRAQHYANDRVERMGALYERVSRLQRE